MRSANRLPEIIAELPVAIRAVIVAAAQQVAEDAELRAPYDEQKHGEHLRDAIHIEITDDGVLVVAGDADAFWGVMVEHGTTHSAPHPFLVPALEENRDRTIAALSAAIARTVG